MNYIENIKRIRNDKRVSQTDMAEKLGIAQNNYGRIERGLTELTVERIYKIAEILEVTVLDILGEVSDSVKNPDIDALKKENKELKNKIIDLEDDKKLLKKELFQIQNQFEDVYISNAFSTILPYVFKEFLEVLNIKNSKGYTNDLYTLFEKLISFDRDSHNSIYIDNSWDVEDCYIGKLIDHDRLLTKILKGFFEESIISKNLVLFQKEFTNFSDKYIQNEYDIFQEEAEHLDPQ